MLKFLWYRKVYSIYHCENCTLRLLPKAIFLLIIVMSAMLISGCRGGGGSGFSSSYLDDYAGSSSPSYTSDSPANFSPPYNPVGDGDSDSTDYDYAHSPEPCTLVLFGIGLAGMAYSTFKKKKR